MNNINQSAPGSLGHQPGVMTATKIKTKVKIALIAGGILLAAAAVGATRMKEIFYSGGLNIYSDYYPNAGTMIQTGFNQQDLFGFSMYADKESVNVKSIKFYFVPQSGADGAQMAKIFKNIKLYRKWRSSGYGYGYQYYDSYSLKQVGSVVSQLTVDAKRPNLAYAIISLEPGSLTIDANGYASNSFFLEADIAANNSWTGSFSVQIDEGTDVAAVGAASGRSVNANVSQAKGNWLKVQAKSPMTVLSPNGGEKFEVGKSYALKWNPQIANGTVQLVLRQAGDGCNLSMGLGCMEEVIVYSAPNTGSYTWTIPKRLEADLIKLPADNLYFLVYPQGDLYNNFSIGRSSAPFSIIGAKVTLLGDANLNGRVDIGDSLFIAQYASVPSKRQLSATALANADVNGDGAVTKADADMIAAYLVGKIKVFPAAGGLSVSLDPSTPASQAEYAHQSIAAANYRITAAKDPFVIRQVGVKFKDSASASVVKAVRLFDGATELTSSAGTVVSTNGYATTTGLDWQIPANGSKILTVRLDFNNIGTNNAPSGLDAAVALATLEAMNVSSGTRVYASPSQGQGNSLIIYKSLLGVSSVPMAEADRKIVNDAQQTIYQFKVTPRGAVALKQFKVNLAWKDAATPGALELENVKLFEDATDLGNTITVVDASGNSLEDATGAVEANSVITFAFTDERQISTEKTYTIKATPRNFDFSPSGSDSVTLSMNGDSTQILSPNNRYVIDPDGNNIWAIGTSASQGFGGASANFLWSDINQTPHSGLNRSSSPDWFNGYLIKYLPLDPVTLRKE